MPIRPDLMNAINGALSASITPSLTVGSKGDDLYEAYVWSVVIRAARNRGAAIEFKDRNGNDVVTTFYFRTSPGELWWGSNDYCHAEIRFPGCPALEAHVGIYVGGRSQVRHECDVAVLYKDEANICRTKHVLPRASKVELAVECKYYINSTPGLSLGRSFLGLCDEIQKPNRFFIATSHSTSVAKLLPKHTRDCNLHFNPVWQRDVDVTRAVFETVFERFIAQHR
jgi:hypothetical protein